jgi:heme-degrading monooxygenase HmoA
MRAAYHQARTRHVTRTDDTFPCSGSMLLEPVAKDEPFQVLTLWVSRAGCESYEASGAAAQAVSAVKQLFAGPPKLVTYESQAFALRA